MAYKKITGIYKITSPAGKVYIGKSKNINQRKNDYKSSVEKVKSQVRLYNSINKYGWENHTFEIIEECEVVELYCRERYWQDFYEVIGKNGLNCLLTKCEEHPAEISEETRKRMSEAQKGKSIGKEWQSKKTEEEITAWKNKISESLKGREVSSETRELLSKNNKKIWKGVAKEDHPTYGRKVSDEEKERHRQFMLSDKNPNRGKKQKEETISKRVEKIQKSVINKSTLEKLKSASELATRLNMKYRTIISQLSGNNYNYIGWVYEEDLGNPNSKTELKNKEVEEKRNRSRFSEEELSILRNNSKAYLRENHKNLYRRYLKYNPDNIQITSEKYTEIVLIGMIRETPNIKEFMAKNLSAYQSMTKRYPHLKEMFNKTRINWTEDKVKQELLKYKSLSELYTNKKLINVLFKRFKYLLEDFKINLHN